MTLQHRATGRAYTSAEEALVARLEALSAECAVAPDQEFRAATRTRLVAMAAVRTPPAQAGVLRRLLAGAPDAPAVRRRTRLTAGLAGAALTVTALGGVLTAAQAAGPGDLLYDVKRGGEQTQLALAGDSRRGLTLLGFASTRLDELGDLVAVQPGADAVVDSTPSGGEAGLAAGPDVDLVLDTLQTMDEQTAEGTAALTSRAVEENDPGALGTLTGWAADQHDGLAALAGAVPTGAQDALAAARDLVGQVAARGTGLQAALACGGGPSTEGDDELGPLPAPCPAAPPATAPVPAPGEPGEPGGAPGTSAPGSVPPAVPGTPTAGSLPATDPAAPTPTGGATPTTTAPGAAQGPVLPSVPAPVTSPRPGVAVPPLVPSLPTPSAPIGTAGPVVSVPPPEPGVSVCLPPLVTVGC